VMRPTRFERKILGAILIVALVPLVGMVVLGRDVVRDAYRIGVNERIREQLESGLSNRRAYLVALRDDAERTADAIAFGVALEHALDAHASGAVEASLHASLERYPHVARLLLIEAGEERAAVEDPERADPSRMRPLELVRELPGRPDTILEVTVVAPRTAFDEYQEAGEMVELYSRLQEQTTYVSKVYLYVYATMLAAIVVMALVVGVVLSRRVTRRVVALARATERVGRGDLTVSVPTDARDEIGELTRAFNVMVRDLGSSRQRIEYLQRIGAWQEFARRLAHEIKNPLTPIQLAAQEMSRTYGGEDPEFQRKLDDATAIIEEEVATLRRLVGEFSSFAKLPRADLAPADLGDFLRDVERSVPAILEDARRGAEGPDVRVQVRQPEEPLPVRIDPMMLKRCVDNLIRNAVQAVRAHRPEGGGEVRVLARRLSQGVDLEVRDNGPGIPAEALERVFDPYYTTKAEGTGLGLAIVKKVVLEHGGSIECGPGPEGGACFVIHLPLSSASP